MAERLPPLDPLQLDPERKRIFDLLAAGRARGVAGPLMAWLRSPKFAEIGHTMSGFFRRGTGVPERLGELAILSTVAFYKSAFQWHGHAKLAVTAGIDEAVVTAIREGRTPQFSRDDERAIYEFVTELLRDHAVADATYARAAAVLDQTSLVELVGIMGYYVMGALTCRAFELDPGKDGNPFR
jgi:4-carboxymuconolactone decarboxylase